MFDYFHLLLPELILLIGACIVLFGGVMTSLRRTSATNILALLTIFAALAVTCLADETTSGKVPPGLMFTTLTFYTRCITLFLGALFILVNWTQPAEDERGEYLSMILFSLLGVLLTASANDWIVFFFAVELVSIPTYVLIALSRLDSRASESSVKYFFLGALSAAILAYGLSFLYGATGTTTIHQLVDGATRSTLTLASTNQSTLLIGLMLVIGGLAFKVAAVPFHVYAPDVYEGAAAPVTGLLGFVPKMAGFIALIKVFTAINWTIPNSVFWAIWIMAALTMTVGNVIALLQKNIKRMLAYSSIAHTGYMLIALLVGPVAGTGPFHDGVAAILFYISAYGIMNLGVFALLACLRINNHEVELLDDLSGIAAKAPVLTFLFAACIFSLMGFPPTAGLMGKWYIFGSAFSLSGQYGLPLTVLAIIGVINSAIGSAYYLRIAYTCYVGTQRQPVEVDRGAPASWALVLCSIITIAIFFWPIGLARPAKHATASVHELLEQKSTRLTSTTPATSLAASTSENR